jgi:hypothetical protein
MAYRVNQPMGIAEAVQGGIRTVVWIGVGLLAVGVYLLLSLFVPELALLGSVVILALGLMLLASYFSGRRGGWALYIGAILAAVGAARLIGQFAFAPRNGLTAIAIGIAFLGISWVRRSAGRGGGWELKVGVIALLFGLLEIAVDSVPRSPSSPGSPGVLDLALPILLVLIGFAVVSRALGLRRGVGPTRSIRP